MPASSGGLIFPAALLGSTSLFTATGPGGGQALSTWSSTTSQGDAYEIRVTGALAITPVPEPANALLLLAGLLVVGGAQLRRLRHIAPIEE